MCGAEASAYGIAYVIYSTKFDVKQLLTFFKIAAEPRKIMETRKRFIEARFSEEQQAEAEVQRLILALLQLPLEVGRVDAEFLKTCQKSLQKFL